MFCNTVSTSPAMLASQWPPNHAIYTEVFLVELPQIKEFLDHCSLLVPAAKFGDKSRVFSH